MWEKGPGLGTSRMEEPIRTLGQRFPAPVIPGKPTPGMGCTEGRGTAEPPESEDPCAPRDPWSLEHGQAGP